MTDRMHISLNRNTDKTWSNKKREIRVEKSSTSRRRRRRRKIYHALQLVWALRVERRLLIQQAGPLWIINLYMPLKHSHPQTQNPKVPAGPGVSISCSSVRQGWKWGCSEDVSSVLRTRQQGHYVKSSPSSLTASPPTQPQKYTMFSTQMPNVLNPKWHSSCKVTAIYKWT